MGRQGHAVLSPIFPQLPFRFCDRNDQHPWRLPIIGFHQPAILLEYPGDVF